MGRAKTAVAWLLGAALAGGLVAAGPVFFGSADGDPPATVASPGGTSDGRVGFRVCAVRRDWDRPTPQQIGALLSKPRFHRGTPARPDPVYYALALSSFSFVAVPTAASGTAELSTLTAIGSAFGPADAADFANSCGAGQSPGPPIEAYQQLWLRDYRVVAMERAGTTLVATVEPDPRTFQVVTFPEPRLPAPATPTKELPPGLFFRVRAETADGRLLTETNGPALFEFGPAGDLRYAFVPGGEWTVDLPAGLDADVVVEGPVTAAAQACGCVVGELQVTDGAGTVVGRFPGAADGAWHLAGRLQLPAGTYRVAAVDTGWTGGFLLLPHGAPWPGG